MNEYKESTYKYYADSAQAENLSFLLSPEFVESFKDEPVVFGFNGVGEIAYLRTYSRLRRDNTKEGWYQTCARVINGVYSIQKDHIQQYRLGWNEEVAQKSAKEMFTRMFEMKWLPPGRGIENMGSPIVNDRKRASSLYNCATVSTENIDTELEKPFEFMMDQSMLGVGVSFDVRGAGKLEIQKPNGGFQYVIEDSREGWTKSLRFLLRAYFRGTSKPTFDYSEIRKAGAPISTGGEAPGPEPLIDCHKRIDALLQNCIGKTLGVTEINDIMNMIGVCVVSGGRRRSAQLNLGPPTDEYINLKNPNLHSAQMEEYRWASNNSVLSDEFTDYGLTAPITATAGEPGYIWLDNAHKFGRMSEPNEDDYRTINTNPCGEIVLENYELCNISETFPFNHKSTEDYLRTLKYAYLYCKSVTLLPNNWVETNRVQQRNRRIGVGMSGIVQAIEHFGISTFKQMCDTGYNTLKQYDEVYSNWFCIPKSVRLTTVKPSGTVSLLAGATSGIHYPEAAIYIRRIRVNNNQTDIIDSAQQRGYNIIAAPENPKYDSVIEIPVNTKVGRSVTEVSIWEQLELAAFMQYWWSDNSVSVTIKFNPLEAEYIEPALRLYQYRLKSVSFLPNTTHGYKAAPYEEITKEEYDALVEDIDMDVSLTSLSPQESEKYCDGDKCTL